MGSFDKANEPAATEGGRPKPEDLKDHLLIVRVLEHRRDNPIGIKRTVINSDGSKEDVPADCIIADVVDLDAAEGAEQVFYDYIFFQSKLIAHFKTNVGSTLLGTLGKYPDQGERKGAYYFTDQAAIPRIAAVGESWVNNNPEFFGAMAPHTDSRKQRAAAAAAARSGGGQANNHGQHSNSPGGEEAWAKVHSAQSTLEQMRNSNNGGFNDEKVPF